MSSSIALHFGHLHPPDGCWAQMCTAVTRSRLQSVWEGSRPSPRTHPFSLCSLCANSTHCHSFIFKWPFPLSLEKFLPIDLNRTSKVKWNIYIFSYSLNIVIVNLSMLKPKGTGPGRWLMPTRWEQRRRGEDQACRRQN